MRSTVRRLAWRLSRLLGIAMTVVLAVGVLVGAGIAIAPHGGTVLTAVATERTEIEFDLTPGAQRTEIFDRYDSQIGVLNTAIDREIVSYSDIPTEVVDTVLAVEDEQFFRHNGFDLKGTMRALLSNVSAGGISQGGSTITQQIIKLRVVGSEQTFNRKLREAILASRLEEELTKEELLEFYLNEIYFGNGAYGIQAAAETYFGKDVGELDYGDASLLAGLIRAPSIFDGFEDFQVAQTRREVALGRLVDLEFITEDDRDEYLRRPLPTRNLSPRFTDVNLRRDYFVDEVTSALLDLEPLGQTREERFNAVYSGGLRVWTTFDPVMEGQMRAAIDEFFEPYDGTGEFEVSMATVEPESGAIRAFIGGPDFADFEFNLATQGKRQPGSSFKTYVLTAAVERAGYLPYDTVSGIGPCAFDDGANGLYVVNNFGGGRGSPGTLAQMTTRSSNCAYVRLGILTGLNDVSDIASEMIGRTGSNRFLPFKSMSLGAQEVTPLEQAVGYSVLANDGVRMEPYYIERVETREGEVLFQHVPRGKRVLSANTAAWVTNVLASNVRFGTGTRAQMSTGQAAAGKTGTAQDFHDAWFVGFTPQLSTAVWIGNPEELIEMRAMFGQSGGVTGGRVPAPLFSLFMSKALANAPLEEFPGWPPGPRTSRFLFLEDEKCDVEIELEDGTKVEFELECADVRVDLEPRNGKFIPRDNALCEIEVVDADGLVRNEKVRCVQVVERTGLTTTTTTEPPPTTTPDPPPTSEGDPATTEAPPVTDTPPTTTTTVGE